MQNLRLGLSQVAVTFIVAALFCLGRSDSFALQNPNQSLSRSSAAQRCAEVVHANGFPNPTTVFTTATLNAASRALPEHCEIFGRLNDRTGIDGQRYAIKFHM